jgi:hypothetical protein
VISWLELVDGGTSPAVWSRITMRNVKLFALAHLALIAIAVFGA